MIKKTMSMILSLFKKKKQQESFTGFQQRAKRELFLVTKNE